MISRLTLPFALLATVAASGCDNNPSGSPPATSANAVTTANPSPAAPSTSSEAVPSTATPSSSSTTTAASTTAPSEITVGAPPPDFNVKASDGTAVHLAALKGKPVVVYFYPKDETPGCTKEACSFRDAWDGLSKKGVVLIGVSGDTDESHKGFATHYKLPFLLVSDSSGAIAKSFGVPFTDGYAARQSFVIGSDGNVKKIYRKVDVTVHAREIQSDLQ
jgi:peroxiredoxin Q/BCP